MKRQAESTEFHAHEREVHVRAYQMWCQDGSPDGRDHEYVAKAREVLAGEESGAAADRLGWGPRVRLTQR